VGFDALVDAVSNFNPHHVNTVKIEFVWGGTSFGDEVSMLNS
jgi:hypothetical protein